MEPKTISELRQSIVNLTGLASLGSLVDFPHDLQGAVIDYLEDHLSALPDSSELSNLGANPEQILARDRKYEKFFNSFIQAQIEAPGPSSHLGNIANVGRIQSLLVDMLGFNSRETLADSVAKLRQLYPRVKPNVGSEDIFKVGKASVIQKAKERPSSEMILSLTGGHEFVELASLTSRQQVMTVNILEETAEYLPDRNQLGLLRIYKRPYSRLYRQVAAIYGRAYGKTLGKDLTPEQKEEVSVKEAMFFRMISGKSEQDVSIIVQRLRTLFPRELPKETGVATVNLLDEDESFVVRIDGKIAIDARDKPDKYAPGRWWTNRYELEKLNKVTNFLREVYASAIFYNSFSDKEFNSYLRLAIVSIMRKFGYTQVYKAKITSNIPDHWKPRTTDPHNFVLSANQWKARVEDLKNLANILDQSQTIAL